MKLFKNILLSVVVLALVAGFAACDFAPKGYEATGDEYFTYTLLEDGTYEVAANAEAELPALLCLPTEYNGASVTAVAANGFKDATAVTEVRIPENIAVIGENAFRGCTALATLYFYKGVTEIKAGAFYGCTALEKLELPKSLVVLGDSAFGMCTGLTKVTLSDKVTTVGEYCFAYCTNVSKVYIPHNVQNLAATAFAGVEAEFEISASNPYYKLDENGLPIAK